MKLLFLYDYFYPGYKAGGPIQSLTNLAAALNQDYNIAVITSAYDLHSSTPYLGIKLNNWNDILLPGAHKKIKVFYAAKGYLTNDTMLRLLYNVLPDIIYINGIFSSNFFLRPLFLLRKYKFNSKIIVCPRGMLQKGALAVKPLKKILYLNCLRISGLLKNVYWHATNQEEADDISKKFRKKKGIMVAPNIPKTPVSEIQQSNKQQKSLRLVYLSLITEKKNLLYLLEILRSVQGDVTLDIYGPAKDEKYWASCKAILNELQLRVVYKGDIIPSKVQHTISNYDAFILLTKGENFGHAIYESLSVGRPVITSHTTPWNNLEKLSAGWNVSIDKSNETINLLNELISLDKEQWAKYCTGAHNLAVGYYNNLKIFDKYGHLFKKTYK